MRKLAVDYTRDIAYCQGNQQDTCKSKRIKHDLIAGRYLRSVIYAFLRRNAMRIIGMFYQAHLSYQIGQLDKVIMRIASG